MKMYLPPLPLDARFETTTCEYETNQRGQQALTIPLRRRNFKKTKKIMLDTARFASG